MDWQGLPPPTQAESGPRPPKPREGGPLSHDRIYDEAEAYDIAFDFRDVSAECAFLDAVYRKHAGRPLRSFLELAAGPAQHTIEMARRGVRATALDLSPAMVVYGAEKARDAAVAIEYHQGDMFRFSLSHRFDVAALLMDSASYLLTNDDVYRHLDAVAGHLEPDGLYVPEISHPKGVLTQEAPAGADWESERGGTKVRMQWGQPDDPFDPITQITEVTTIVTITRGDDVRTLEQRSPQRCFTATEFRALVEASGRFRIVDWYGAMDAGVPFDNAKAAWRMVPVLQRV